jgi:hypothetical protein
MVYLRASIILGFLLIILTPISIIVSGYQEEDTYQENRRLASLPEKPASYEAISNYPRAFEDYWADHFGLRKNLVRYYTLLRLNLGIGLRDKVLVGKDNWFYGGDKSTVSAARNAPLLTEAELTRWGNYLQSQHDKSLAQNAPYLFVIVPNKATLYPEYLPRHIRRNPVSRIDQILEYLATHHPDIDTLDLRPILFDLKKEHQVFHKGDTHWNLIAAYKSYLEIVRWLNQQGADIQPERYDLSDFYLAENVDFYAADIMYYTGLNAMLGVARDKRFREKQPLIRNFPPRCAHAAPLDLGKWYKPGRNPIGESLSFHANACEKAQQNLLIFRDSFATLMEPFLAEHFAKSVFIYGTPTNNLYAHFSEQAQPDYVIEQIIERFLEKVPEEGVNY